MEFVDYKCLESLLIEGEELIATEGFTDAVKALFKKLGGFIVGFFKGIAHIFSMAANKLKNRKIITDKSAKEIKGEAFTLGILTSLVENSSKCGRIMTNIIKKVAEDVNKKEIDSIDPYIDKMHAHCNAFSETVDEYKSKSDWVISENYRKDLVDKFNACANDYILLAKNAEAILKAVDQPNADEALGKEYITEVNQAMNAITKDAAKMNSSILDIINIINNAIIIDK